MSTLSLPLLLLISSALLVRCGWGVKLSNTTDVLATRLGLGEALGGLILLAIATNLRRSRSPRARPWAHNLGIAIGNILGGIAIQTVVLLTGACLGPARKVR